MPAQQISLDNISTTLDSNSFLPMVQMSGSVPYSNTRVSAATLWTVNETALAVGTGSQAPSQLFQFRSSLWNGSTEQKGWMTWRDDISTTINGLHGLTLYESKGNVPSFAGPLVTFYSTGSTWFRGGSIVLAGSGPGSGTGTDMSIAGNDLYIRNYLSSIGVVYIGNGTTGTPAAIQPSGAGRFGTYIEVGALGLNRINVFAGGSGVGLDIYNNGNASYLFAFNDTFSSGLSYGNQSKVSLSTWQNGTSAVSTGTQKNSYDFNLVSSLWNGSSETKGWFSWRVDASTTTNLDQDLSLYVSAGTSPTFALPVMRINKGGSVMSFGYGSNEQLTTSFTAGVGQNFHITSGGGGYIYRFYDNTTYAGVKAGTLGTLMLTIAEAMLTVPAAARFGTYIEVAPGGLNRLNVFAGGNGTGLQIWNNNNGFLLFEFNDDIGVGNVSFMNFTIADAKNIVFNTATGSKIGSAANQKLSIWGVAPNVQPTNAIVAAAFVANTSGIANDSATYGGYTAGQIVAALKRLGALA